MDRFLMDAARPEIVRRRPNIEFGSARARGWLNYRQDIEDFLNTVSFVFPTGEKFFIQSVQNFQDRITDPVLREQVSGFIYQEAMHSKEHSRCNVMLAQTFSNGHKIEELVAKIVAAMRRFMPNKTQLAVTCALEHFTAILSDGLLRWQETFIAQSEPAFANMWLWHAVEETEHKAVCFDVYQQVSGKGVLSYLHRVAVMMATTAIFLAVVSVSLRWLKQGQQPNDTAGAKPDDAATPPKAPGRRNLFELLKVMVSLKLYFDYYRPSFHPWNDDNTFLIEEWKQRHRDLGRGPDAAPGLARA